MSELLPIHGGSRVAVPYDLSTNANRLGPSPFVMAALRRVDVSRYPDPSYARLRQILAAHHRVSADRILVGAGASELILRLVRRHAGPVRILAPSFSEYRRCALVEGRAVREFLSPEELVRNQADDQGLAFACWPNNPTGHLWDLAELKAASMMGCLVVDLAYAPLCDRGELKRAEHALSSAWRLYSPNKAHGVTGLRAAYLVAPEPDFVMETMAPSWVLDAMGVAFLEESVRMDAQAWVADCVPQLQHQRQSTAAVFREFGHEVIESPANFLMAKVDDVSAFIQHLQTRGVCVRDAGSFGRTDWIRMAGAPPQAIGILVEALARRVPAL